MRLQKAVITFWIPCSKFTQKTNTKVVQSRAKQKWKRMVNTIRYTVRLQIFVLYLSNPIPFGSIMTLALFGIRFHCCVFFIRQAPYWNFETRCPLILVPTYYLQFPFIVYHGVLLSSTTYEPEMTSPQIRYVSQQRGRTRFLHLRFPYQQLLIRIPKDTCTHAFSPWTS